MTNNDILRKLRYCLDFNNRQMLEVFLAAKQRQVASKELHAWLQKDDSEDYKSLSDKDLATFLNGLISQKRGDRGGAPTPPESTLNNNIIFRKLKIAFELRSEDILEILSLANFRFSEHELSALFRKPEHKHYRVCKDQVLRNFLMGLQLKLRPANN